MASGGKCRGRVYGWRDIKVLLIHSIHTDISFLHLTVIVSRLAVRPSAFSVGAVGPNVANFLTIGAAANVVETV